MITAGVDAGSRAIKIVIWNRDEQTVLGRGCVDQGVEQAALAARLLDEVIAQCGLKRNDIHRMVATGYGRDRIEAADTTVTEITCQARGVFHQAADARTVIDIGGQDSKLLRLQTNGKVRDFVLNDRCAAGTGRFMEVVAARLEVGLEELGALAAAATRPSAISNMCVVFAETEIIGLLAAGEEPGNIVAGVLNSIASRIASMAGRQVEDPIVFTGGVALVPGMDRVLATMLKRPVAIVANPRFTGALGAAILGGAQA